MPYSSVAQLPPQFAGLPEKGKRIAVHIMNILEEQGVQGDAAVMKAQNILGQLFAKGIDGQWAQNKMAALSLPEKLLLAAAGVAAANAAGEEAKKMKKNVVINVGGNAPIPGSIKTAAYSQVLDFGQASIGLFFNGLYDMMHNDFPCHFATSHGEKLASPRITTSREIMSQFPGICAMVTMVKTAAFLEENADAIDREWVAFMNTPEMRKTAATTADEVQALKKTVEELKKAMPAGKSGGPGLLMSTILGLGGIAGTWGALNKLAPQFARTRMGKNIASNLDKVNPESYLGKGWDTLKSAFEPASEPLLERVYNRFKVLTPNIAAESIGRVVPFAAVGVGGWGAAKALDAYQHHRTFNRVMETYPELQQEDPDRVARSFELIKNYAPTIAKDPLGTGGILRNMLALPDALDTSMIKNLIDIEKGTAGVGVKFREGLASNAGKAITEMGMGKGQKYPYDNITGAPLFGGEKDDK